MDGNLLAFGQVVAIDLVLAGDNAVVIAALAAGLPGKQRRVAIVAGISLAVIARILMSGLAVFLLMVPGLPIVGGLLLLWVAWKLWKDLSVTESESAGPAPVFSMHRAILAIVAADISMSLDNVLGVSGAAQGHVMAMVFGLILSVVLMGMAAAAIASVFNKHRWIGYVGLVLIIFVALRMLWHGVRAFVS